MIILLLLVVAVVEDIMVGGGGAGGLRTNLPGSQMQVLHILSSRSCSWFLQEVQGAGGFCHIMMQLMVLVLETLTRSTNHSLQKVVAVVEKEDPGRIKVVEVVVVAAMVDLVTTQPGTNPSGGRCWWFWWMPPTTP